MHLDKNIDSSIEEASTVSSVSVIDMVPDDEEEYSIRNEVTQTGQSDLIIGKRICRCETPSEAHCVEQDAHKMDAKRTRTGLRTLHERKKPEYFYEYVMNMALTSSQVLDRSGKPIRATDIELLRSRHEMLQSKWQAYFLAAELEEMAALKSKCVIAETEGTTLPKDALLINNVWVYAAKTNQ